MMEDEIYLIIDGLEDYRKYNARTLRRKFGE